MATIIEAPISPMSAHACPSLHEAASKINMTHLSGATMADLIKEPSTIHLINASPSISIRSSSSSMVDSNRHSIASTTKSTLRHSNHLLIEMLQNIQTELSAHRSIMLDIQHRVSHLEQDSVASVNNDPPLTALHALEGRSSKRNSKLVSPEGQAWWQACQNFAKNSDPPLSTGEFLRTPRRFSGIDWQYGSAPSAKPQTPPTTPPAIDDLPPLTPPSEKGDTDLDTPHKYDTDIDRDDTMPSIPKITDMKIEDDIKEHTVEIDKKKMPAPPILQPPPVGKPISVNSQEAITPVLPVKPLQTPHRYYKGVRSLATYKALMKNKGTDKEHYVLIHFHRRADLKDLKDEA